MKIKYQISLLAGLVLLSSGLLAQNPDIGIKAGLNISNISVSPELDPPKPSPRIGISLGAYANFGLSESVVLRSEATFSTQGGNDEDTDVEQKVKLSYLNVAGLFDYGITDKIKAFAGPQIGFLIGGELLEIDKVSGEEDVFNATSIMKGIDFSLVFGAGYSLNEQLSFDVRYYLGLNNINNDQLEVAFYDLTQEVKNRNIQVSVNYNLNRK
jgi:opacity protein-like surface antigen